MTERETCTVCGQPCGPEVWSIMSVLITPDLSREIRYALCSPACVTEKAWELRQAQEKLSKSRQP